MAMKKTTVLHVLAVLFLGLVIPSHAMIHSHTFVVADTPYNRLCSNKSILTVNGQFPGPTIYVTEGDTIAIRVVNGARENITIHWHGVKQPRYPWSDGPEYITQCPIRPGTSFNQSIVLSDEVGTLWWHAHSDWSRATVHGALIIHPRKKNDYPFPVPDEELIPIILGEWWKSDVQEVLSEFLESGGEPNVSDAFVINGQPGDLYPCSSNDTFKLSVDYGKTYLVRMVNAVMNNIMFFKIKDHNVIIVGSDGAYTKNITSDYIAISPGQTIDFLLYANQSLSEYYMAARPYGVAGANDNTTTTARIVYRGSNTPPLSSPPLPTLPEINDTRASTNFSSQFKSLAYKNHPIDVPSNASTTLFFTLSINNRPCIPISNCSQDRLLASVNNITFRSPRISILEAYYDQIDGVYDKDFPSNPPRTFNYTDETKKIPRDLWDPQDGTKVRVLDYNSTVELVFQGTNMVSGIDHPMHLHGHSFYVVGWGFGNFNRSRDSNNYNLVDPPFRNTIAVPVSGWTAIRFRANNPGVWLMHCHIERHISWGMMMVFITKDGKSPDAKMKPPPTDFPKC